MFVPFPLSLEFFPHFLLLSLMLEDSPAFLGRKSFRVIFRVEGINMNDPEFATSKINFSLTISH
jgi:hypothetical protein